MGSVRKVKAVLRRRKKIQAASYNLLLPQQPELHPFPHLLRRRGFAPFGVQHEAQYHRFGGGDTTVVGVGGAEDGLYFAAQFGVRVIGGVGHGLSVHLDSAGIGRVEALGPLGIIVVYGPLQGGPTQVGFA